MSDTKKGSFKLNILKGIPVSVHWTFLAGGLLISVFVKFDLPDTICFCIAYALLVIIHELAHATAARFSRLQVFEVEISGTGGLCLTESPRNFSAAMALSSAGILAQVFILVSTLFYIEIFGKPTSNFGECLAITFIYVNVVMLVFNTIPSKEPSDNFGTDGYLLWKLLANRIRGRPYTFPDTSATFPPETRLIKLQGFMPSGFKTGIEILNDNDTTMEFVVSALTTHVNMPEEEAISAMLDIHKKGGLLISMPTYEKAIGVATAITSGAKANGFNLICRPVDVEQKK